MFFRPQLLGVLLLSAGLVGADTATFDLTGPAIGIKVKRGGTTLPISQVPNLHAGDRLWVHPELPKDQSAHYLLVVTFLRGSTNPSPDKWFTRAEAWSKKVREEGIFVTVPDEAEQAVVFLAPETSGDFSTLRSAVRGRPGAFVRAVQDLNQASLDRSRLDTYLAGMRKVADVDPAKVHEVSVLLARSLAIHLDDDCFKKPVEEQAGCLTQKGGDLVLNDGHSQSIVGALTTGSTSDLVGQLSYTPQAGLGYFSPYIGAIMDMGRILDSLHTAQYQYIPALSLPQKDMLDLKLNNPPSFHNPKSVILVALPAVKKEEAPPLRHVENEATACAERDPLVLPVQGAPLAFSTDLAHNMKLQVQTKGGKSVDLPVKADASKGGFVIDDSALADMKSEAATGSALKGTLHGRWGFDAFTGPAFELSYPKSGEWTVPSAELSSLTTGSAHKLQLEAGTAACVDEVKLKNERGDDLKVQWKAAKGDQLEVTIPAESARESGQVELTVKEAGIKQERQIPLRIYGESGHMKRLSAIPGDNHVTLEGTHLETVESVELAGAQFVPRENAENEPITNELQLSAANAAVPASLKGSGKMTAHAKLKDGRRVDVPVSIGAPRPSVSLLNKAVELGTASGASLIHLGNEDELPQDGSLSFSIKSDIPAAFERSEKIEIATADYSFHTLLSMEDGSLTLQDPRTVVGHFEPGKSFGTSAFGPVQFRPVDERNEHGDWKPLAKLVRVPSLKKLDCPSDNNQPCTLKGANLFLLAEVGADPQFSKTVPVPEGFISGSLDVPHPMNGTLYLKLRDNPADVNTANFPLGDSRQAGMQTQTRSKTPVATQPGGPMPTVTAPQ